MYIEGGELSSCGEIEMIECGVLALQDPWPRIFWKRMIRA